MLTLALRNLFHSKTRLLVSVGSVALALTLILAFDAIFTGAEGRLTLYIDRAGADVFVSQTSVRNMHMSLSALPVTVVDQIESVPGVASVTPIMFVTNVVTAGGDQYIAYVIGLPAHAATGTPWDITAGKAMPGSGETIIDESIVRKAGIQIGDRVEILGQPLRVVGLTRGTTSLVSSLAFIAMDDFARARGDQVVSYVLVRAQPGQPHPALAERIETAVPSVTAQTREQFVSSERKLVKDMSADLIGIMNVAGFLIGLAVLALGIYIMTIARRREYGILKALGARNTHLYQAVSAQALVSVALGLGAGLALTLLLTAVMPLASADLVLRVSGASLLRVALISGIIAGLSAVLPARQIAGLDPAIVYRGR